MKKANLLRYLILLRERCQSEFLSNHGEGVGVKRSHGAGEDELELCVAGVFLDDEVLESRVGRGEESQRVLLDIRFDAWVANWL